MANVLVLGDYRQTITVVRSLAGAGFGVVLGTDDPRSSTAWSRCLKGVWVYERSTPERFRRQVEEYLRAERPAFVFPVGESQLRHLLPVLPRLEKLSCWANPGAAAIGQCFDKRALYSLAQRLGVPTPAWREFTSAGDWRTQARAMGYPVVIKRKDSEFQIAGRKAVILDGPAALDAFLDQAAAGADAQSLVLQRFAPGIRHNCHVAAADGELVAYFEQKVLRTDERDDTGIGVAGISVAPSAALRGYCEQMLRALRYDGIGCIQFLVDGDRAAFLEINPRMDSTAVLPYRLGYDYPRLAVQLAAGRKARESGHAALAARLRPVAVDAPYAAGRRYHWLYGEAHAWIESLRHRRRPLGELAAWAARIAASAAISHHLTWQLSDPLPTAHMFWKRYARIPSRWLPRAAPRHA